MRRRQSRYAYAIERGYLFDYGAVRSIREDASGSQRHHYFLARDEGMYVLLAQQTLVQTVGEFLTDHGVDLGQFNAQVQVIFDQSIKIGDISGSSGIAIGKDSTATVGGSSKGSNSRVSTAAATRISRSEMFRTAPESPSGTGRTPPLTSLRAPCEPKSVNGLARLCVI